MVAVVVQQTNKTTTKMLVSNIFSCMFYRIYIHLINEIVVVAPSNHYQPMPAAQRSNSEYERGDIALGAVKPKNEYGQLVARPATYDELQLKPPGTDYADASVLQ